jgi:hypothetical protein
MQHDAHCLVRYEYHLWRITYLTRTRTGQFCAALSLHQRAKGRQAKMSEADWLFDDFQAKQYADDRSNEL